MRLTKTLIAAAIASTVAGSAFAGGFAVEIVEPPIVIIPAEPAGSSSYGFIIPVIALAALAALALSQQD